MDSVLTLFFLEAVVDTLRSSSYSEEERGGSTGVPLSPQRQNTEAREVGGAQDQELGL